MQLNTIITLLASYPKKSSIYWCSSSQCSCDILALERNLGSTTKILNIIKKDKVPLHHYISTTTTLRQEIYNSKARFIDFMKLVSTKCNFKQTTKLQYNYRIVGYF